MGIDSITISSRLRNATGGQGSLQDLEDTINSTGKRRIAKFEMSIADPEVLSNNSTERANEHADKVGSTTSRHTSEEGSELDGFDIDAFTRDYRVGSKKVKKEHVFGRAEVYRGDWDLLDESAQRDPHDRFEHGPAVQRYVPPLFATTIHVGCQVLTMHCTKCGWQLTSRYGCGPTSATGH